MSETPTPPLDPSEYPNLRAILDGRIAGHWTEWPMVRVELMKLLAAHKRRCAELRKAAESGKETL